MTSPDKTDIFLNQSKTSGSNKNDNDDDDNN